MDATHEDPLVAEILIHPIADAAHPELQRRIENDPIEGAELLERLAEAVAAEQPARASRWLAAAAELWSGVAGDPRRAGKALRTAIELAPADDEILARLVQLYRENDKHKALTRILERRADALAALAEASGDHGAWLTAEQAFVLAERWGDASRVAERRGAHAEALEHLGRTAIDTPEARLQIARLEAAALAATDLRALKLSFELSARALAGRARAAELVRQAEVLVSLGADRPLAVRHAEVGLVGLSLGDAAPLLARLSVLMNGDEAIDLYQRHIARSAMEADRSLTIELAAGAAVQRGTAERIQRFFEAVCALSTEEPVLGALERAATEGDRARGGAALRGLLAAAFAAAEPDARDGGRARSALLRRAARIARRDLDDPDLAFEWLGDALFARVEGSLAEALAPLQSHTARTETALSDLCALLEQSGRGRSSSSPPAPPASGRSLSARPRPTPEPPASGRGAVSVIPPLPIPGFPIGRRLAGEDLIADLFESMHALDFCKDALDGASFTLNLAMGKLAAAAGFLHLYDIDRREFVLVRAAGPGAVMLQGLRTSDADPLIAEIMRTRGALILRDAAIDPRLTGGRWDVLRSAIDPARTITSVASARFAQAGRFLGLIELCHLDGGVFAGGDEHAMAYIALRFTEFVAERGILLGDET